MKILVTGTAGFIGFHLARALLERGDEVVGIDNINDYYDPELKFARLKETGIERPFDWHEPVVSSKYPLYTFIRMDITDHPKMEELFATHKFDRVVHLAAQAGVRYSVENPHAYIESNIVGFMNILECCRHIQIPHLIYASSSSVYGLNEKVPFSEDDNTDRPASLYAATKKSNELMAHVYSHLYGLQTTGLRFFTVYGPWGRPDMALFLFVKAIFNGEKIEVYNHGEMMRDFTYVDDIIQGVEFVIDQATVKDGSSALLNNVFNIGNGQPVSLTDFIDSIERYTNLNFMIDYKPIQPGDVKLTHASIEKITSVTGYSSRTNVTEGIKHFIQWYEEHCN